MTELKQQDPISERDRDQWLRGGGGPPAVDPTELTTTAVNAATEQIRRDITGLKELLGARLDAMDVATDLRLQAFAHVPALVREEVARLQTLHDEKFRSIELQFLERDTRVAQTEATSKQALDAALLAAKELVGQQNEANVALQTKAELSTIKQIDGIIVLVGTIEKAFGAQVTEIKERLDRNEGGIAGGRLARDDGRLGMQIAVSIVGAMLLLLSVSVAIYVASHK